MGFASNAVFLAAFRADCEAMNLTKATGERLDAGEVAYVAKELEYVQAQTYDIQYPELKALQIIPVDTSVPSGAETFSYFQWDYVGQANFVVNYATDFPSASAFKARVNLPVFSLGNSYEYTIQDVRAAQARQYGVGQTFDIAVAKAARDVHAQKVDDVAAYGDTARGLVGFVNATAIPDITPVNGSWDTLTASDADQGKRVYDLNKLVQAPEQATLGINVADTLVLALSLKVQLMNPTSTFVREPLLLNWLKNQDSIKSVIWWNKLDSVNSGGAISGTKNYAMAFKRDPTVLSLVIPQPFEQFAPQQKGLAFQVLCHSRIGGVCIRYPLACARMQLHS